MRIDLHIHTNRSKCSSMPVKDLIKIAARCGLDGIAITDHNTIKAWKEAKNLLRRLDSSLIFIRGEEISSKDGHILALGIQNVIKRNMSAEETIEKIHEQGGIAIFAHPFDYFRQHTTEEKLRGLEIDGIEVFNSRCILGYSNSKAKRLAAKMRVAQVAGSDAHFSGEVGNAYTIFKDAHSEADVIKAIKKCQTIPAGKNSPIFVHLETWLTKIKKRL
ncbi:MAG: PHP domain-containing protein [Candidatus Aenigmarchaeota archaeon]|nr:PHP domain-containing protein [Candidatus Aenigmarchaeota archaeon]